MRTLSKSKLLAYRQCPKRLWLELHRRNLRKDSAETEAKFKIGNSVGDVARRLYDPKHNGILLDVARDGFAAVFAKTAELIKSSQPIFEAGFSAGGAIAFADVMLPVKRAGKLAWRMLEVKSSTSVKGYHLDDVAIQAHIATSAGARLDSVSLVHIKRKFVYPGRENYTGLFTEAVLTKEAKGRDAEVREWIADAQAIASRNTEPKRKTGSYCNDPYECGFIKHCRDQEPKAEYPIRWLPRATSKALKGHISEHKVIDMRDVPNNLLNEIQLRVKSAVISGKTFFDKKGAAAELATHPLPVYFLDFETIQFAVPIWEGTRPYQTVPYQFSVQRLSLEGSFEEIPFLDCSGADPSRALAEALIAACGERGTVYVYNATFERGVIDQLALDPRFTRLARPLNAINARLEDLLPITRNYYFHPEQEGSWSIKKVLPTIAPDLDYENLDGVQDGGMASIAFLEAISPDTTPARRAEIEKQLLKYCGRDTLAMVRLWQHFGGGGGQHDLSKEES